MFYSQIGEYWKCVKATRSFRLALQGEDQKFERISQYFWLYAGCSRFKSPLYWLSRLVIFVNPPKRLPGLYSEMGDVDFAPNPFEFTFHYYSRASDDANPYPALNLCRWITHNLSIHIGRGCVGKPRHTCEDMKTDLTETGCEVRHWTELVQDRALWFVKSWKFPDRWNDCSHCVRPS